MQPVVLVTPPRVTHQVSNGLAIRCEPSPIRATFLRVQAQTRAPPGNLPPPAFQLSRTSSHHSTRV